MSSSLGDLSADAGVFGVLGGFALGLSLALVGSMRRLLGFGFGTEALLSVFEVSFWLPVGDLETEKKSVIFEGLSFGSMAISLYM